MRKVKRSAFLAGGCALLGGSLLLAGVARADGVTCPADGYSLYPAQIGNVGVQSILIHLCDDRCNGRVILDGVRRTV